ncbi:MAG TPA: hypothetical protein VMK32_06335 [Burkholderiaceae bacterium]|nr:hypothetical protein [Burkholderiaceae bacterium]
MRRRFRRKSGQDVTAVRLQLDFDALIYRKWGGTQTARSGDWLVDNGGDVYTVAADSFARTYREVSPGRYAKSAPVWAEQAARAGSVKTKEGRTHYKAGDWLVSNADDGSDAYAVSAATFLQLYEPDDA